nr:unnamed protein product [Callosobruchus chinensis]
MNCQHLTGFHLGSFQPKDKVHLNDGSCYFILTKLVHNLTHLSLDCSTLSACSFASILRCKHLEHLCLNYAYNFRGCDFQSMWKTLAKLKVLKVRNGHLISEINCSRLFTEGQGVMTNLEVIDFTGCGKIANGSILAVSKCCKNIKRLIVRSCRCITTIDSLVANCPELEMLNIGFCDNIMFDAVPLCIKKLFISDSVKHRNFARRVMQQNKNCEVRVCLNEFNKDTKPFIY